MLNVENIVNDLCLFLEENKNVASEMEYSILINGGVAGVKTRVERLIPVYKAENVSDRVSR